MKLTPRYMRNEVMQMIGRQRGVTAGDFHNVESIWKAHAADQVTVEPVAFAMDVFIFGMICGKRAERQRRKRREQATV